MKKVRNNQNLEDFYVRYELNLGKSETIPDQSLSIREILVRFSRGLDTVDVRQPLYNAEDDKVDPEFVEIRNLDRSILEQLRERNAVRLKAIQDELSELERIQKQDNVKNETLNESEEGKK